ncbi:MAG TPA: DeoR/GlpR family DNA-binding transcription regulator [Mycobacteriales bacterium]|nr:DeoR/GlpR family DNA-binding transcription regulator [Mycobacteriales bacterium]
MSRVDEVSDVNLRYGSAPDRRGRLLRLVTDEGFCTIAELAQALNVSDMTVRRDVSRLERDQCVRRVHGGVTVLPPSALNTSDFGERARTRIEAKRRIARHAAGLIGTGATVGIDAGTTNHQLALILPEGKDLTVATHSLPVLTALQHKAGMRVIAFGGELHPITQDFAGIAAQDAIANVNLSILFLGAKGLNERGVFCASDHEALVKRKLLEVADRVIVLADSSKLSATAMVRVCSLEDIDTLVTDAGIGADAVAAFTAHGVEVTISAG